MRYFLIFLGVLYTLAGIAIAQTLTTPGCYNLSTTAVTETQTSCTAPTAPPTIPPTPPPTPNPGVFGGFVNGQPYPAAWQPYSPSPVFASPLPVITPGYYTTDSATIVAEQWASGATSLGQALHNSEPGIFDTSVPVYVTTTSDAGLNIVNPIFGNAIGQTGGVPATANIVGKARPTQSINLPSNMTVFQPSGSGLDMNVLSNANPPTLNPANNRDWQAGQTVPQASYGSSCSNYYTGTGIGTGAVSTTMTGLCGAAGLIGLNDLIRGEIDHTILVYTNCVVAGTVFPAYLAQSPAICTDGVGPQLGYTMYYDVPCATTIAAGGQLFQRAILCALNLYGGIVAGTLQGGTVGAGAGGSSGQFGFTVGFESSEPFYAYGNGDKFAALFSQGWTGTTIPGYAPGYQRWFARPQDVSGNWVPAPVVNFLSHIHYIKSCVKAQTC